MTSEPEFKVPNFLANRATCQKFCGLYEECLSTLSDSFPECTLTQAELQNFREKIKGRESDEEQLIRQWHTQMLPFYERADRHDDAVWSSLPLFQALAIDAKRQDAGFGPESVQVLWEYVDGLSRHARIYNAIPEQMLNSIQTTALSYVSKVKSGEMKFDLENLNVEDIKNMGQSVVSSIDPRDIDTFVQNLSGLAHNLKINNIDDVLKLVGDLPGLGDVVNPNDPTVTNLLGQVMNNPQLEQLIASGNSLLGELASSQGRSA